MTTKEEISDWFIYGKSNGYSYMAILCDTFAYEDYPCFFNTKDEMNKKIINLTDMTKLMETYDLTANINKQLNNPCNFAK